jgi:plastocyanin
LGVADHIREGFPVKSAHASILALAALLVFSTLSCGGDDDNPAGPGGGTNPDVTINILGQNGSNSYSPSPDTVTVGQTVAWNNSNGTLHTATANNSSFNTGNVSAGSRSGLITMNTPGTFSYHCTIHPTMTGTLVVK